MDEEHYEIIYEKGVPVIAFQICAETEEEVDEEEIDNYSGNVNDFDENQTLQYFKEDETEKIHHSYKEVPPSTPQPHKTETKKRNPMKMEEIPMIEDENLDFVIVKNATKCNSKKLYDALGYSYTLRNVSVKEGCSFWRCRFKVDDKECGGKIKITSDEKLILIKNHRHLPDTSVSFSLLKQTRMEPIKPKTNNSTPKTALKYQPNTSKIMKSPKSKPSFKSHSSNSQKKSKECEKMLDYFSEGQHLDTSENDDIDNLLYEEDEEEEEEEEKTSVPEDTSITKENEIAFKVIKNGSITGTHILYDSLGYSYNIIERKGPKATWGCQAVLTADGKNCDAKVRQAGLEFNILGLHSHSPKRHTLLKINKMEIFSSQKKPSPEKPMKRRSSQKHSPLKKMKTESLSYDSPPHTHIKHEQESFEFNTKDISFLVSLENDENDPTTEGNIEVETDEILDHDYNLKKSPKKARKGKMLLSRTVPHVFDGESFSMLKELAILAFADDAPNQSEIRYQVIENGSCQGGPKLYDSRGYFYTIRYNPTSEPEPRTNWFCCSRGEKYNCRAKVNQKAFSFTMERDHCHPPDKEKFIRSLIRMEAVEMIKDPSNLRRSGMNIVKGILNGYGINFPFNINVDHLVRFVNYQKKSFMEHNEISNCRYTFNKKKIPKNFLLDKITTDYKFHLTFATENQLAYLAAAGEWYIDEADFDVPPFTNLFSIHVYISDEDQPRQIPVFFALISERRENDYTQVFSTIKSSLNHPPSVSSIIIDLNIPLRRSILKSFPNAEIKCCDLHWSEDISNKLKEMDLSRFFDDPGAMNYLYQLPLLNLLPRQDFETALCGIEREIEDVSVQDLICYIRETFGERSLWTPKYWSSFKMPIQINNHAHWREDILGHNSDQEVYSFIRTLYLLSKSVGDDLRLMSKKKIKKYYLGQPDSTLYKVYQEWKNYCKGEKNCHTLLEKLASIIHVF